MKVGRAAAGSGLCRGAWAGYVARPFNSANMFRKLLIANRGEIARRINRVAKGMGLATVAVFSDADQRLPFVREADQSVRIGPAPAKDSYLNQSAILDAAQSSGAEAIHPG